MWTVNGVVKKKFFQPDQELICKNNRKTYNYFNFNILRELSEFYPTKLSRVLQYKESNPPH